MEAEMEEGNIEVMKLPVITTKPNSHSYSMSSPLHSSMPAAVPFSWEEEPGKPKQSSYSSSSSSPLTCYSSSSPETHNKCLELPPRLHSPITVFDGPYNMGRSRRLDSSSFRMMVKNGNDCYGSFRGELEVAEEQHNANGSLDHLKKKGRLGFFGFMKKKPFKGKTELGGRGSYVFPSSVDRKEEEEEDEGEGEDKRFGYGDGISSSQSSRFSEVKIPSFNRTGSYSTLPPPSSKSHFWMNVCAGLKHVVPWKHKKTTG